MFAAQYEPAERERRRRGSRAPAGVVARVEPGDEQVLGPKTLCRVADITVHGCKLETYTALSRGAAIWLTLPGGGTVAADVIWADDFNAGCVFLDPLRQALVDRLAKLHR